MLLQAKASANKHDRHGCPPLEVVRLLLHAKARVGTALAVASEKGHTNTVNILLQAKALVDEERGNKTEMMYDEDDVDDALEFEGTPLGNASAHGHLRVVRALLQAKACVEKADGGGHTPLWRAARRVDNTDVVRMLLQANARVDDIEATPPLVLASGIHGNMSTVAALLEAKATVEQTWHTSPLLAAASVRDNEGITAVILAAKAALDDQGYDGFTALACAAIAGNSGIVRMLLAAKAAV